MSKRYFTQELKENIEKPEFPVEEEAPVVKLKTGVITNADLVNLRRSPSMDPKVIIGTVKKGDKFELLDKTNGFWKVKMMDGRTGYVALDFCKEV